MRGRRHPPGTDYVALARASALAYYRRKHNVHPLRYRVGPRRLICCKCWNELTEETAVRRGRAKRPMRWCRRCWRAHMRAVSNRWYARKGSRLRKQRRRAARLQKVAA